MTTMLSVEDVMSKNVVTVSPNRGVADAALEMAQAGISCVVVIEQDAVESLGPSRNRPMEGPSPSILAI